jgi:pyruvate-formate lyase-activating enzyme
MKRDGAHPYVVYSRRDGGVGERRHLRALSYEGQPLELADLIPLPDEATLCMLPRRLAAGMDSAGARQVVAERHGWALAALLPIGYTRTRLPAYEKIPETEPLPFFGYTAVAGWQGRLYAAAVRTDNPSHWLPHRFDPRRLERLVRERLDAEPENRVLRQHAHCALDYQCPTASNLFFSRWEAAIATSPGCNARCVGCISKQDEDQLVSPQDRLLFVPTEQEIVDVAVAHLERAPEAIISFGQGCEGEPLLQARLIERAIRAIRARTSRGTININSNASQPRALQRLYDAGLDSLRASTISARPETYTAYYRPVGYTFEDVKRSLLRARDAGVYASINLLSFPGYVDAEDEAEALVAFLRETGVRLVQMRTLNIDPEVFLPRVPRPAGRPLGVAGLIALLRRELPALEIGNFSRPVQRASRPAPAAAAPPEVPARPPTR